MEQGHSYIALNKIHWDECQFHTCKLRRLGHYLLAIKLRFQTYGMWYVVCGMWYVVCGMRNTNVNVECLSCSVCVKKTSKFRVNAVAFAVAFTSIGSWNDPLAILALAFAPGHMESPE